MCARVISKVEANATGLSPAEVREVIAQACPAEAARGRRVLILVPDATRTAPIGLLFKTLYEVIGDSAAACDVMTALGTHPPMSEDAICRRLGIAEAERREIYGRVRLFNHAWNETAALARIGCISSDENRALSDGLFAMDVEVKINRRVFDYDRLIIIGPVFPHEVVGFSGGNKYLFPGISGPEVLNYFHWLGAVVTNPVIIGNKITPVRKIIDRAAAMLRMDKLCFCAVVDGTRLAGLFAGAPEAAWNQASDLSRERHIRCMDRPFHTVLSCAPEMYEDLWTGGKCMYKLESVVSDGGELIIYAPHIREVSITHGRVLAEIGYHCVEYFLKQWERFNHLPWGVLAHASHVRGIGTFENGVEKCRVRVTLATGIPPDVCSKINMGYRNPATIDVKDFANREDEGVLLVPKAGEMLYRLRVPPAWARGRDLA